MQNISYVRAGISCLPFVGPLAGTYNAWEVSREIAASNQLQKSEDVNARLLALQGNLGSGEDRSKAIQKLQEIGNARSDRNLPICEKGRLYSICAAVGNVLTVATIVSLVALGILSGTAPVMYLAAGCTLLALVNSWQAYRHSNTISHLQAQIPHL